MKTTFENYDVISFDELPDKCHFVKAIRSSIVETNAIHVRDPELLDYNGKLIGHQGIEVTTDKLQKKCKMGDSILKSRNGYQLHQNIKDQTNNGRCIVVAIDDKPLNDVINQLQTDFRSFKFYPRYDSIKN